MPTIQKQKRTTTTKKVRPKGVGLPELISLEDLPDDGIKLAVYGKSGTGKTRFMSTFAKLGKLLHIICSSNGVNEARSIRGVKNITVAELTDPDQLPELIEFARKEKYATVSLDHVTGFADLVLAKNILGVDRIPEQASWGLASQQQYQQQGLQVKTYLRGLIDLKCNVILIGQERVYGSTEENESLVMPNISIAATPSVAGWIAPAVDYLCQTFKRNEVVAREKKIGAKKIIKMVKTGKLEYCLRVGPDELFMTKFRVPPGTELPDVVVDPSYEKISGLIEGNG